MPTSTLAWFHCFSGIAGDMALGALLDAGAPLDEVVSLCRRVSLEEPWQVRAERVARAGLMGTRVHVDVDGGSAPHRRASEIVDRIGSAGLPVRVAERALATFGLLAEVEGALHGVPAAEVTFHEVGATDSIVDTVGVCAALDLLGVDEVRSSALAQGHGTIRAAHGVLPNPPPAVVALLARVGAPTVPVDVAKELTTPTGAALLAALASGFGPMPALTLRSSGFGAGGRDLPGRPNLVQVVIGEREAVPAPAMSPPSEDGGSVETLVMVETTLDDVTGEQLGYAIERLLAAGALDAWATPAVMKKGRPGHVVSALARPELVDDVRSTIVAETGTLGVRIVPVQRWAAARCFDEVDVGGFRVRMKISAERAKPEFADVAAAAAALGLPAREVARRAEVAWASG